MVRLPTTTSVPQTLARIFSRLNTLPGWEANRLNNSNSFLGKFNSWPWCITT